MNKQEFLAMSLPHKLKIAEYNDDGDIIRIEEIYGGRYDMYCQHSYYKSILRPLPDLTKEIEHKGEKFVPIDWLEDKYYTLDLHKQAKTLIDDTADWIFQCDFLLALHLIEWHFDILDLISEGGAIDVNTLKTNPYK